ncbi:MAG: hypothetical protein Fur0034_15920 [Desulfuromonadia bacterium]
MDAISPPRRQVSILYAEQDGETRARIGDALSRAGYRIISAPGGEEAKRLFTEFSPDLVLTEYTVTHHADGLEIARYVKDSDPFVPVILASECLDPKGLEEVIRCGVNSFVSKPFDEGGLLSVIKKHAPDVTVRSRIILPSDGSSSPTSQPPPPTTDSSPGDHRDLPYAVADLEYRLLRRNALLEAVNRDLEDLCDAISHDLRAPLARLQGYVSILSDVEKSRMGEEGIHSLQRIDATCREIKRILDGLVQVSYYSRCSVVSKPIDLSRIASETASSFSRRDSGRSVRFVVTPGLVARGDETLMKIVIYHLYENAWKFTKDSPDPSIFFGMASDGGKRVFFVRDNGMGFPPAAAPSLFKPFTRLNDPHIFPGDGLGLAIVQRIIKRHGGRIWCDSEEGMGATFYFTL